MQVSITIGIIAGLILGITLNKIITHASIKKAKRVLETSIASTNKKTLTIKEQLEQEGLMTKPEKMTKPKTKTIKKNKENNRIKKPNKQNHRKNFNNTKHTTSVISHKKLNTVIDETIVNAGPKCCITP
jgi:hypothetical protein